MFPDKISMLALSLTASISVHTFAQKPLNDSNTPQYKITCENHHESRWHKLLLFPKNLPSKEDYLNNLYQVSLKNKQWTLEKVKVGDRDFVPSGEAPLATLPENSSIKRTIISWAKNAIRLDQAEHREHKESNIDIEISFIVNEKDIPFTALECSKDDLSHVRYTAEIEKSIIEQLYHHNWRYAPISYESTPVPMSLIHEAQCQHGAKRRFDKPINPDHKSWMQNPETGTKVYAINACMKSKDPLQIWVKSSTANNDSKLQSTYKIDKIEDPFTQRDHNGKGHDTFKLSGISSDDQSIAISVIKNNEKGDYSTMVFGVTVIKNGQQYHLPQQKIINTYWQRPDAVLSESGNRLVIHTGISVKLFEYNQSQDQFLLVGEQSLKSIHPWSYREGSLYITSEGERVFFAMHSPRKENETSKKEYYLVSFNAAP